jgi:hypothetical protein
VSIRKQLGIELEILREQQVSDVRGLSNLPPVLKKWHLPANRPEMRIQIVPVANQFDEFALIELQEMIIPKTAARAQARRRNRRLRQIQGCFLRPTAPHI